MVTIQMKAGDKIEVEFDCAEETFEISCDKILSGLTHKFQVSILQTSGWELDPESDNPNEFEPRKIY